jgi:hypothetical protein
MGAGHCRRRHQGEMTPLLHKSAKIALQLRTCRCLPTNASLSDCLAARRNLSFRYRTLGRSTVLSVTAANSKSKELCEKGI